MPNPLDADHPEECLNCGGKVLIMAFRGTGICSENCRKEFTGEAPSPEAIANK